MANLLWDPESEQPKDAAALEAEIERIAPGAQVKLTLKNGQWLVRALAPAAMCARGGAFATRDLSATIAELLADHDHPAAVFPRR